MKVLIVDQLTPFQAGPDDVLAAALCRQLERAGHEAEIMRLPFAGTAPDALPSQLLMLRAFELMNVDHVVALSLPAALVRHPRKTLWIDARADTPRGSLFDHACAQALAESRHVYVRSVAAQASLPSGQAAPLALLPQPGGYDAAAPQQDGGSALLAGAAVLAAAPVALLLDALALAPHARLRIAGVPADAATTALLAAARTRDDIGARLALSLDAAPSAQMIVAARAVVCIGAAPDAVDGAAFARAGAGAARALIARNDSDHLDLARTCLTGWCVEPAPAALAHAFETATLQPARAQAYGRRAHALLALNRESAWDDVLEALLR